MNINALSVKTIDILMFAEMETNAFIAINIVEIDYIVNKVDLTLDDIVHFLNANKEM